MKRLILMTALLAGSAAAPLTPAAAMTFSGSQMNTNAPGTPVVGDRCPAATVTIFDGGGFTSTGASNFGAFTASESHCIGGPPPTAPGATAVHYEQGLFTYTFADGDTLSGSYDGVLSNISAGLVDNVQNFVIDAGTGRFAGATGSFEGLGTIDFTHGAPLSKITITDGVVFAPGIPEPTTWALLVAGFGAVGGVARARRRSASRLAAA